MASVESFNAGGNGGVVNASFGVDWRSVSIFRCRTAEGSAGFSIPTTAVDTSLIKSPPGLVCALTHGLLDEEMTDPEMPHRPATRVTESCRRKRSKNVALLILLFALVLVFYAVTIVRIGDGERRDQQPLHRPSIDEKK